MDLVVLAVDIGDRLPLGALWGTMLGFVIIFCASVLAMGMGSRNLTIGMYGSYLCFAYFAIETGNTLLQALFYVSLTLVIISVPFKLWRAEGLEA